MTNTNFLLRIFASLVEVSMICLLMYHIYLSPATVTRTPARQQGEVYRQTRIHQDGGKIEKKPRTENRPVPKSEYIVMENCPTGWPLEILKPPREGRTPAQVCRNADGTRHWMCDPAWVRLKKDPFCAPGPYVDVNVSADSAQVMYTSEEFSQMAQLLRISTRRKLLYVHIPYTGGSNIADSLLFNDSTGASAGSDRSSVIKNITGGNPAVLRDYYRFTMVRHPCSRLISAWERFARAYDSNGTGSDAERAWTAENLDSAAVSSFDAFVRRTLSPGGSVHIDRELRLRPQADIIASTSRAFGRFQEVLVYERWNESVVALNVSARQPREETSRLEKCGRVYTRSSWAVLLGLYRIDFCVFGYSSAIDEEDVVPPLMSNESIATRIEQCKKMTADSQKLSNAECVIHTYFELPPGATDEQRKSSEAMIGIWKFAWMSAGWKPRVLTAKDARNHTAHGVLSDKLRHFLPTGNLSEYDTSSFNKYIAMSAVGGGWLSDYDVIPLRMPMCVSPLNGGFLTVYQLFVPSLISGSGSEFLRLAEVMTDSKWKDKLLQGGRGPKGITDMQLLSQLVKEGAVIGMRTVVEARHLFGEPFGCDKSWPTQADYRYFTRTPPTLPQLPWVVHFSYPSVTNWISANRTELWPGSSWNAKSLDQGGDVRPDLMRDALQYLNGACSYNKNFH